MIQSQVSKACPMVNNIINGLVLCSFSVEVELSLSASIYNDNLVKHNLINWFKHVTRDWEKKCSTVSVLY